jgi:hypothetical protein
MIDSAFLKVERAAKHITEVNDLLRERRPFSYILETYAQSGDCATFARKNDAVVNDIAVIIGDVITTCEARSIMPTSRLSRALPPVKGSGDKSGFRFHRLEFVGAAQSLSISISCAA